MKRIGLLSDTHSYLDVKIFEYFKDVDEIWHAGDIGNLDVTDALREHAPLRAVYGNIDDATARQEFPENQVFELEGVRIWMTHIGGYPPKYSTKIKKGLALHKPQLFICGHSHILKAIPDRERGILHLNPGAAGHHGFHKVRTAMRFALEAGRPKKLEVIELGQRGARL